MEKRWKNIYENLSDTTKKILSSINLQKSSVLFLEFNIDKMEMIELDEVYIVIGNDLGTSICINHKEEVVSIDTEGEYPIRFVNKNLESLLECVQVYLDYEEKINVAEDEEIAEVIGEIKNKMNSIDTQALSTTENWWSIILEQVDLGLL